MFIMHVECYTFFADHLPFMQGVVQGVDDPVIYIGTLNNFLLENNMNANILHGTKKFAQHDNV